jgi:mono/diheme cytochrome c family protein
MFSRSREHFFGEIIFRIIFLLLCLPAFSQLPDGKQLFTVNCSPCHTLGQGEMIGPDLDGIMDRRDRDWLIRFIRSSQTLIKNGDQLAVEVFEAYNKMIMPDQSGLSGAQIDAILAYIDDQYPLKEETVFANQTEMRPVTSEKKSGPNNTPGSEEVSIGRDLFIGKILLSSGGPACITCHNVTEGNGIAGGQFAPDLTNVYSRIDEKAIMDLSTNPVYPSMQKVYKDKPIMDTEASHLAAYLKYAGTESAYQQERDRRAADFMKRINRGRQQ